MNMSFTDEHKRILEKNRVYYNNLVRNGTLTKMSSVTVGEFSKIYNEAVSTLKVNVWCAACVIELIELCYLNYDKYLKSEREKRPVELFGTADDKKFANIETELSSARQKEAAGPDKTFEQLIISTSKSKGKNVHKPGRTTK